MRAFEARIARVHRALPEGGMTRAKAFYLEIFAICLAVIVLEIGYTRIFSFKVFYYFTYLIIGLALLGLGTGGVLVAIFPRLRGAAPSRVVSTCGLLGSATVLVGYFVIARTQLNAFYLMSSLVEVWKLSVIALCLFLPFLAAGIVIATIFSARPEAINRLYCADLLGAGLGCALAVPLIYLLTPPGCVMLAGLVFAIAGIAGAGGRDRRTLTWGVPVAAALSLALAFRGALPDPVPDAMKTLGSYDPGASPVVFSRWSPVFRVDVMPNPFTLSATSYIINHDGHWGSVLHRFDGNLASLARFESDPRALPFDVVKRDPKVLIIGSAGGHEILASLYFGAGHVTAVELNPVTLSLLTDHFAEYSGHLGENERVTLVNAEGRSYLNRMGEKYDLIWFVAPDSYAAMNAATTGAFVLSESYLYTVEMVNQSLDHLEQGGVICVQFGELDFAAKPNRTVRYLATAREACRRRGRDDFARQVVVATSWGLMDFATIMLKKTPFTADEVRRVAERVPLTERGVVRYMGGLSREDTRVMPSDPPAKQVITLPDEALARWYDSYPYLVRPVTDDSPFFWHFARFRDVLARGEARRARGIQVSVEDLIGERVQVALLAFVSVFAALCLLLPFAAIREVWRAIPYKGRAATYFAALGIGFMFFEVSLIQMLTLFLGYPTYSLSVTLFGLLVFSGIGSLASGAYRSERNRALAVLLVCLAILTVFYQVGMGAVVDRFVGAPLGWRVALTIALIAPLGLCLGAFMPLGLATVAAVTEHKREFVAWAWAVNGFFSVISAILSTILAMTVGFKMVLMLALVVYVIGGVALVRIPLGAIGRHATT
jgi:hypothetical protein